MTSTLLETVEHYPDSSRDFITDIYCERNDHPLVRAAGDQNVYTVVGGNPKLTILRLKEAMPKYKQTAQSVFYAVLADGGCGLMKAVFNSSLSSKVREAQLHPGCTLEVKDYAIIWHQLTEDKLKRAVMFIKDFDYKSGPKPLEGDEDCSSVTPEHAKSVWHSPTLDDVMSLGVILFCDTPFSQDENHFFFEKMPVWKIRSGLFYPFKDQREEFLNKDPTALIHPSDEDTSDEEACVGIVGSPVAKKAKLPCNCTQKPYRLKYCVLRLYPLDSTDEDQLFEMASDRLGGATSADDWNGLFNNHKRWCYYWFYAVNIFHVTTGTEQLPNCLVDAVRELYPQPGSAYVGYKGRNKGN